MDNTQAREVFDSFEAYRAGFPEFQPFPPPLRDAEHYGSAHPRTAPFKDGGGSRREGASPENGSGG